MMDTSTGWVLHPGTYIKEEMDERGWLQRDLAFILGVTEQAVNIILSGKRGISPDMAMALGDAFDVPAEFFANLQKSYDLSRANPPSPSVAVRAKIQGQYPVREMIKRGWFEDGDSSLLQGQLTRFFGVESSNDIPFLAHAAKRSSARRSSYEEDDVSPAQLAWLFRVKQIARSTSVPRYSEKALRGTLSKLTSLMLSPEEARHVPKILAEAGIRLIFVEKLPQANIDGVCFWIENSPVIGMSLRYDRIDNFWFVLRHEIEHVLRGHGMTREIFDQLDGEASSSDAPSLTEEERVANEAAANFCAPSDKIDSFIARKQPYFYEKDVLALSRIVNRHPGLVVGQIQRKISDYAYLKKYQVKVRGCVLPGAITDGWGQTIPISL